MSIYSGGVQLAAAYGLTGQLSKAYNLSGAVIWSADGGMVQRSIGSAWKFKKVSDVADVSYTSTAEAAEDYDDSAWETVRVPHDWSIYNNFNRNSAATYEGGFLDGGDAWYRTTFKGYEDMLTNATYIGFDGVYMEADVYVNGQKVGQNKHGYAPFWVDISDVIRKGDNTLAVFVRNRQPSSRWYSGSGIYRPVYLLVMEQSELAIDQIVVTTPELEAQKDAAVDTVVNFRLRNFASVAKSCSVKATIAKGGKTVVDNTSTITAAAGENTETVTVAVNNPDLWDVGAGNLYTVTLEASCGADVCKSYPVTFGYRWTKWDVDTGFWLNGVRTKIKGVCMHHDLGCIGAEANRSAMERQIDMLIKMGCNAIRLTHNPSSTMFLELCEQKGVMLVEELFDMWTVGKSTYDFHLFFNEEYETVIRNTILRDRNNPAIIMWSLGNEINRTAKYTAEEVRPIITKLIAATKAYDTTRPVTMGEDSPSMDAAKVCMELLDVCGINYNKDNLSVPHGMGKPSYGSETTSALSSRGVYAREDTNKQCSSFDDDVVSWGSLASAALKAHMESEYSGGQFVWTGFDYIGEPTPFNRYPAKSSYFGIVDLAGIPKDIYYMYQSRWTTEPMIHIVPMDWDSWTVGDNVPVWLYSNCAAVELFQDGVSLGKMTQDNIGDKYQFAYTVTFAKGELIAKGYNAAGEVVANDTIHSSTGIVAKARLSAYRDSVDVSTDDLVFITCDVLDENDVFIPTASTQVTFTCEGGTVLGTDNGNAACVENMRQPIRSAFNGKCLCVCRHDGQTGTMTITATAYGVQAGTVTVNKV